ncbi:MAG TPA: serine/threonine-protein kinase [bacterium]|nr:serine/threonine-protein kinase [bacterium]HQC50588.1 serine/threonine-protein kinase [bacterium]
MISRAVPFGRYLLIEKIACGGTAELYRAIQESGNGFTKEVAIKRLLPMWCDVAEVRELLFDEARLLAALSHPSIVQVWDYDVIDGQPYIAMEHIAGLDCAKIAKKIAGRGEKISEGIVLEIASRVLSALDHAHNAEDSSGNPLRIVHRDISPSNIVISGCGEVKLIDFGIAKGGHRSRSTVLGQLKGKYAYMSPEQASCDEVDCRSDLFSLAVVLLEMASGRRIFFSENEFTTLDMVRRAAIPDECVNWVSGGFASIVMPALSLQKDLRYGSAAEMLDEIEVLRAKDPAFQKGEKLPHFMKRNFRRRRCEGMFANISPATLVAFKVEKENIFPVFLRRVALSILSLSILMFGFAADPAKIPNISKKKTGGFAPASTVPEIGGTLTLADDIKGSIAVDSSPTGAAGEIRIEDKVIQIRTPFHTDDIDISKDVEVSLSLSMNGRTSVRDSFFLSQAYPVHSKSYTLQKIKSASLIVHASPWGVVSIPNVMSGRETPALVKNLSPGKYSVSVKYPPTGRIVTTSVDIPSGGNLSCVANFDGDSRIRCR